MLADEMDDRGEGYAFADALAVAGSEPAALCLPALSHRHPDRGPGGPGALASRSELVAMRATGMSIARILFAALMAGLLLALLAVALGEFVAPLAEQAAVQWRSDVKSGQVTLRTPEGFWARDGEPLSTSARSCRGPA